MARRARTAFDVRLSTEARETVTRFLSRELQQALAARSPSDAEIAYYHILYEQGRTRGPNHTPWPDAADLTSPIGTEKVDALRSRIVRSVFADTIWTAEGYGDAAQRAPFAEEFLQWQAEVSGFQSVFGRAAHLSLIEGRGVIEVYEDSTRRPVRKTIDAALEAGQDGSVVVDGETGTYALATKPDGTYQETTEPNIPTATVTIDSYERIANGPMCRVLEWDNYLQLPEHARERSEVWGHAKRFWRRVVELKFRAKEGVYDTAAVEALGADDERVGSEVAASSPLGAQEGKTAEKELWEVTFLDDLDGTGLRWYVATLHRDKEILLRLQYDDVGRPRYFHLVPFPKPGSTGGYSFIGNKLITAIEENTAYRNMLADRTALQVSAPMKRLIGALWDPDDQPWGPKAIIDVRDMNEIQPVQVPDYTGPARERIIDSERQAEKLAGMSDIASGSQPNEDRTLGETKMVLVNSEVRIDEVVKNVQEPLEELASVLVLMWRRALSEMGEGVELPTSVLQGLENRGADLSTYAPNKRMTAAMLAGPLRFRPKGSVETADINRVRMDFNQSLGALAALAKVNPMVAAVLQSPMAAKALLTQWARLYRVADKQAFASTEALRLAMLAMQANMMRPPGAGPGGPGPAGPPATEPAGGPATEPAMA